MKKEDNVATNWLDELFDAGDERTSLDYKNYTTAQLVEEFNLDEPKGVTVLKDFFKVLLAGALIALCVFLMVQIAKPIELPAVPVQQTPAVEQTKPQEEQKEELPSNNNNPVVVPPVVEEPIVEEPTIAGDWENEEDEQPQVNDDGMFEDFSLSGILNMVINTVTSLIDSIDIEELEATVRDIVEQIKAHKKENVKLMLSQWDYVDLLHLKNYVADHKYIHEDMKTEIIQIIDEVMAEKDFIPEDTYDDTVTA